MIYVQVLQFFLKISMHILLFIWRHYTQFQNPNVYWMTMCKYCKFAPIWWGFDKTLCRYCLKTLNFNNANVKLWWKYMKILNLGQKVYQKSKLLTTTYCAFLRRAKQKTWRVCEAKTTCHICDATRIATCGAPTIANL